MQKKLADGSTVRFEVSAAPDHPGEQVVTAIVDSGRRNGDGKPIEAAHEVVRKKRDGSVVQREPGYSKFGAIFEELNTGRGRVRDVRPAQRELEVSDRLVRPPQTHDDGSAGGAV